jgi:hypothetical protein
MTQAMYTHVNNLKKRKRKKSKEKNWKKKRMKKQEPMNIVAHSESVF